MAGIRNTTLQLNLRRHWWSFIVGLVVCVEVLAAPVEFRRHELLRGIHGGYQVQIFDVNADGTNDLVVLGEEMDRLIWLEGPGWQQHVLVEGLERPIHSVLFRKPDTGRLGIVVADGFSNNPPKSTGRILVGEPESEVSGQWRVREIDRVPTAHRLGLLRGKDSFENLILNAPLAAATSLPPGYKDPVPLIVYRISDWKRVVIDQSIRGVLHGINIYDWNNDGADDFLTASFEGVHLFVRQPFGWKKSKLVDGLAGEWPKCGASEIAVVHVGGERLLATIEPWHGSFLAVYRQANGSWQRQVIDDRFEDGHAVIAVDLDGDGSEEIVAGYRRARRVIVYWAQRNGKELKWQAQEIDRDRISPAGCAASDLTGDGKPDIVCIGTHTENVVLYENSTK